jgi:ectoine hydroxylase-related dioxygenase (phytanoyl-CoA dioxygenase family)
VAHRSSGSKMPKQHFERTYPLGCAPSSAMLRCALHVVMATGRGVARSSAARASARDPWCASRLLPRASVKLSSSSTKQPARELWGDRHGDSPQAARALELFLKRASPEAAAIVDEFLKARRRGTSLDDFLLSNLRRALRPGEDPGPFVLEWQAFASGAIATNRNDVAAKAWTQWEAFGGANNRATPLLAFPAGETIEVASRVRLAGVARMDRCLSAASAAGLRAFVLASRDESVTRAASDKKAGATELSRVLSPRDVGSSVVTRWDVRLPWVEIVRDCMHELMGAPDDASSLGHALSALSGGDSAQLFECAAVISAEGAAPQIVHADTIQTAAGAQLFTVFVALQEIADHQGPTRFLPYTHTCTISHRELERDSPDAAFCQRTPSVSALLGVGDVALYDSRTLHCGGPHRVPANLAETRVERVLFYVSFKHALTTEAELSNRDVHGAGSILPSVAAHKMSLGVLRARRSPSGNAVSA